MLGLEDGSSEIDRGGLEALTLTQIVQRRPRIEIPMCCNIIANRCKTLDSDPSDDLLNSFGRGILRSSRRDKHTTLFTLSGRVKNEPYSITYAERPAEHRLPSAY
jgi:hypothetical protein